MSQPELEDVFALAATGFGAITAKQAAARDPGVPRQIAALKGWRFHLHLLLLNILFLNGIIWAVVVAEMKLAKVS